MASSTSGRLAELKRNMETREARVGIVGMGYVGLPLALLFSAERFRVSGFDIAEDKVAALNQHEKSLKGAQILVLGLACKRDIDDLRESPSLTIIELLRDKGAVVAYNDP